MILRVTVPAADAAFRGGYIDKWHKQEGEPIEFGDDLCDIAIDEFMALQRTKRASLLGSTSKLRTRRIKDAYDLREGRGRVTIRLRSSEGGVVLGKVVVPEGGRVDIGSLIALMSGADGDLTGDTDTAPDARIAVNMPDADDLDPFD
jgi:pyruvate/2-oxoglutarate dehydrogenase complex dihydrolipoamide acyltransferase (E2) component